MLLAAPALRADEEQARAGSTTAPADAEAAISRFKMPRGFKAELFAAEPRVMNISSFCIDERGRFYVVEVFRRRGATLDLRWLPGWLDDDLASRSVADRIATVKRRMTPEQVKALEKTSDRIRIVEDRDGDGRADFDTVFTDGYNKLEDGTAAGVLARAHEGDVYFANIPNLWRLRDTDGDGKADVRTSLHYGFGVRYAFSGHDLHGLRFGPDGRLYFSVGDRALHVEKDGKVLVDNPDSGAVLRCEPDGSNLELVHTGLRNPQELAFDPYGNLFTGDNNSDGGDASRWVYVVEGGDSGWRAGYQHHDYPVTRGPWNNERLWDASPPVPAAYIVPPVANPRIAGPAGLTYVPGPGMPRTMQDRFLLVDFRGSAAGGSGVYMLRNKPSGASFTLVEEKEFLANILPTDVEFGYDGGVYVTDWVAGWEPNAKGRIYRIFDPRSAAPPVVAETKKLMARGMAPLDVAELEKLLSHPDIRVRQAAQFELAGRGSDALQVALTGDQQLPRLHAIWCFGQVHRKDAASAPPADEKLLPLLADTDEEVRAQAAKVLGELRRGRAAEALTKALSDPSPRVRYFAATSLGKLRHAAAAPEVLAMLRADAGKDAYLRHAGVMALAGMNSPAAIESAAKDASACVRLAALLVRRRAGNAKVSQFLADPDPQLVLEAARAIHDLPLNNAMPKLASLSAKPGLHEWVASRVLNANYRLGTTEAAAALATYATRAEAPEALRVEALRMLGGWEKPARRDWVTGQPIALPERDAGLAKGALAPAMPGLLRSAPDPVRIASLFAATALGIDTVALHEVVADAKNPPGFRAAALSAMAEQKDPRLAPAAKLALADPNAVVRVAAIRLYPRVAGGIQVLGEVLAKGSPREQQAVLEALATVTGPEAEAVLMAAFDRLEAETLPAEARLDLLLAAGAKGRSSKLAGRLKGYETKRPKDDPLAGYREALVGGDAARGAKIFRERADVSCLRCHSVSGQGGNAGPDLAGLSKRADRPYILESILSPNKQIAKGWETVTVQTADDAHAGVLKFEDEREIHLDVPNVGLVKIRKSDIRSRQGGTSAMPEDIAKTLSKKDVRDLVEYLSGL
jgi:quinoprotein glucose dehydrogenase